MCVWRNCYWLTGQVTLQRIMSSFTLPALMSILSNLGGGKGGMCMLTKFQEKNILDN